MSRCVIVGGADIGNFEKIKEYLSADDFCIFCDCGYRHIEKLCVKANLIVGDFDSIEKPCTDTETIVLPCEKDDTDTLFAVKEGIKRGFDEFLLVGMAGNRLDHTLGNVYILEYLQQQGKQGKILDDYGEIELVSSAPAFVSDSFSYFSLLNITGAAKGITVKNAKYPLENAEITCGYQYGISNEVCKGKTAEIALSEGKLLLIKIY